MSIGDELGLIGLALSGIASLWAFLHWRGRPQFICGIPPSKREQLERAVLRDRLGEFSVATGFRHRSDCFAERFRDRPQLTERQRQRYLNDIFRTRHIQVDAVGAAELAVILENCGGRAAKDYTASIAFLTAADEPPIQITDTRTESLEITSVYSGDPSKVGAHLSHRTADRSIVDAYNDYLSHAPSWGDGLFLKGTLEAGMYELVAIAVEVPRAVGTFLVTLTLDCSDGSLGAESWMQGCRVVRGAETT